MLNFLTENILSAIRNVNINLVYELRIRANKPVVLNYGGNYTFLGGRGITENIGGALVASYADIEKIIYRASEFSVYSVSEQLRRGFIAGAHGERIGLAGEFVYENGSVLTVKDVTSLNIRVPHEVRGCGEEIYRACFMRGLANALIVSAPGRGKTTILRDLARLISSHYLINILINDERNEICACNKDYSLDTGAFTDIIRYADKRDSLVCAMRSMRPDLIITDEVVSPEEADALAACVRGGITVIASAHCKDLESLLTSPVFARVLQEKVFEYYIVLSSAGVGNLSGIYDADLRAVSGQKC